MIRRPPRSTLFPTRRSSDLVIARGRRAGTRERAPAHRRPRRCVFERRGAGRRAGRHAPARSEEHTSELQSHSDLVCRLLLEKKKKKKNTNDEISDNTTTQSP